MTMWERFRPARGPGGLRNRLFVKYLVVLVGLVGGALLVTSLVALWFTYQDTKASASRLVERAALQGSGSVFDAALRAVAEASEAVPPPGDGGAAPADRAAAYRRQLGGIRQLTHVGSDGAEGLRVAVSGFAPPQRAPRLASEPAVAAVLAGADWGPHAAFGDVAYPDGPGTAPIPLLMIAVADPPGRAAATVAEVGVEGIIPPEFRFADLDVDLYLVDSAGRLLARPPGPAQMGAGDPWAAAVAGHPDLSARPQVAAAIRGAAPAGVPLVLDNDYPAPRPADWQEDLDGVDVLGASAPVPYLGWQVFAVQPRSDVLAPVYSAAVRMVVFLAVFLVLAVIASALLARRMARPITEIEAGARRIGEGAFDERIAVARGDELGRLAETFNDMAAQLGELHGDLERRVDERTRDLSAALEENAALMRRLEERGRELEAASRHKSEFLTAMSHELRTPLNAIIGFSEVLQERAVGGLNERQAAYIGDIRASGRHLLALIEDLLDLAKIEAGRVDLDVGATDVAECIEMGFMMVRERAARRGVRLEMDVDPAVGRIPADERRLRQVLVNLLSNAVRFSPEGGVVLARARPEGAEVRISVHDDGPGIAPGDRERIFETFEQLGRGGGEGTGLGLPLSRALVQLHGGRLWVESRVGEGSAFVVALPARVAVAADA
jgi:signal transduction histidine kinase